MGKAISESDLAGVPPDDDWRMFVTSWTTRADALHPAGRRAEAETRFREAE